MRPVVSIGNKLMSTCNKVKSVLLVILLGDVLAEGIASTSRRHAPATSVVWVRPQKVAHRSFVRNLLHSV